MADRQIQPWSAPPPERPPESPVPLRTRVWRVLRRLYAGGWLRPRRIGCLLVVAIMLVIAVLWALGSIANSVTAVFRDDPAPVPGSPFDTVAPAVPASSGSPTVDRVTQRGRLIVGVVESAGLAERSPDGAYDGFDIALLELVADDLGVDPAATSIKPLPPGSREGALTRHDVDLIVGGYEITPQRRAEVGFAGPYLTSPLRLAVPAQSPVRGLDSLGGDSVCVARGSSAEAVLADRLGDRLATRGSLGACVNLLGRGVAAVAGDQAALRALPAVADDRLRLVGEPLATTEYGFGLPPGDEVLRDRVTAVLREAIEEDTWDQLYAEYLGTPVPTPPELS